MTEPVFVDTNVLLYALDEREPQKQVAAWSWREELWRAGCGRVSFQVLEECYVQLMRMWPNRRAEARAEVLDLMAWKPVAIDAVMLEHAWKLQDRYRLSFWDALIVAAAKAAGCGYLLTEDLQAGQRLDGIVVVNPFLRDARTLIGQ